MSKGKPTRSRRQADADRDAAAEAQRAFIRQGAARARHAAVQRAKAKAAEQGEPEEVEVDSAQPVDEGHLAGPILYPVASGETLRNPRRAAKLRKSGRLRTDPVIAPDRDPVIDPERAREATRIAQARRDALENPLGDDQ